MTAASTSPAGTRVTGSERLAPSPPLAFAAAIAIGIAVGLADRNHQLRPHQSADRGAATIAIVRGLSYVISGGRELIVFRSRVSRPSTSV